MPANRAGGTSRTRVFTQSLPLSSTGALPLTKSASVASWQTATQFGTGMVWISLFHDQQGQIVVQRISREIGEQVDGRITTDHLTERQRSPSLVPISRWS